MAGETEGAISEESQKNAGLIAGRRKVTAALLVAMIVTAMEQLVVSPAMPTIIAHLKGFEIYPWVISAYLLASTVSTPIYGKLADLYGRKRILLFGLVLFSIGSMLSGAAQSMGQLIAMRTIQGLGAGAVAPIILTLLGDLFSLKERASIQGLFSAVWGISSVAGPLVGGWLTDQLNWRWVFFVSVPFAVLSIVMVVCFLHENVRVRSVAPIDWAGAGLLTTGLSLLLFLVLDSSSLSVPVSLGLGLLTIALLVAFVFRELRAEDPILSMELMTHPTIATSVVANFLLGGVLFGLETYVPLYIQGVSGGNATEAGQALTPLFLAWAISVAFAARAVVRWGFRRGAMVGAGAIMLGVGFLIVGTNVPSWWRFCFTAAQAIIGTGMGPASLSFLLVVQSTVNWHQRGVATGAVIFFRTIGGAIGVGILGGLLGRKVGSLLLHAGAGGIDVSAVLRPETHSTLAPAQLVLVQNSLRFALHNLYLEMLLLAAGIFLCATRLPARVAPPEVPAPLDTSEATLESELSLTTSEA